VATEQPVSQGAVPQEISVDLIRGSSASAFDPPPPPSGSSFSSLYVDVSAECASHRRRLTPLVTAACLLLNSAPQSSPEDAFGISLLPIEENPPSHTAAPDALGRKSSPYPADPCFVQSQSWGLGLYPSRPMEYITCTPSSR
jgi:hypothetical protein